MGVTAFANIAIVVLSAFGFVSTTYADKLAALPDRLDNRIQALGFGLIGLVGTFAILGIASGLTTLILVNILLYFHIW